MALDMLEQSASRKAVPDNRLVPTEPDYIPVGFATTLTKRGVDIVIALAGLVILAPLFLFIAFLIKLDSSGPVFFRQARVGRRRRLIRMWKFRKMYHDLPHQGPSLTKRNDRRMTAVGRFLERTKLDELPQLINVLLGDMSLVGPRPEVPKFVAHLPQLWDQVLSVKPGIFGPSQLRFRNESELYPTDCQDVEAYYVERILPPKLARDAQYARRHGFLSDGVLLVQCFFVAVFGSLTPQTIINRRWQIANFLVLSSLGIGGTVLANWLIDPTFRAESTLFTIGLAAAAKPLCLLAFKIPKSLATSMTAEDFLRSYWCGATCAAVTVGGMFFTDHRDVGRLALLLDTIFFAGLLVGYKLACYKIYVCFFLQKSRELCRFLLVASLGISPLGVAAVLTVRHGRDAWQGGQLPLSLALVLLATCIRPLVILFRPIFSRPSPAAWLLREGEKLLVGSLVGSCLMIFGTLLLNERKLSRGDIIWDNCLYLLVIVTIGLWRNRFVSLAAHPSSNHSMHAFQDKERLLIAGSGLELSAYISALTVLPENQFEIVGVIATQRQYRTNMVGGFPIIGEMHDIPDIIQYSHITRLIVVGSTADQAMLDSFLARGVLQPEQVLRVEFLAPVLQLGRKRCRDAAHTRSKA